jgi:hypothetical protein
MKLKNWLTYLSPRSLPILITLFSLGIAQPAQAQTQRFSCDRLPNQNFATFIQTRHGDFPLIEWHTTWANLSPEERCKIVSGRFHRFDRAGELKYLRTGSFNGHQVICVATRKGGICQQSKILVTLPPGSTHEDAKDVLLEMRSLIINASNNHLLLSSSLVPYSHDPEGNLYLNFEVVWQRLNRDLEGEGN